MLAGGSERDAAAPLIPTMTDAASPPASSRALGERMGADCIGVAACSVVRVAQRLIQLGEHVVADGERPTEQPRGADAAGDRSEVGLQAGRQGTAAGDEQQSTAGA